MRSSNLDMWKGTCGPIFSNYNLIERIRKNMIHCYITSRWLQYCVTGYLVSPQYWIHNTSFSLSLFVSVALISSPSFCVSLFCLRQAVTWSWWRTLKGSQQESPAEREESAATSGSTASSSPPPNRNACSSRPSGTDTRCLATCTRRTGLSTVHTHVQLYAHAGIIKVSLWASVLYGIK